MQLHHSDDGCYTSFRFGKRCRASCPLSARYAMHTTIGYVRCGSSQRSSLPRSLSLILGSRRGSCAVLESAEVIHYNLLKFLIKSGSPGCSAHICASTCTVRNSTQTCGAAYPCGQPRGTWAATISREIRCDSLINEHFS